MISAFLAVACVLAYQGLARTVAEHADRAGQCIGQDASCNGGGGSSGDGSGFQGLAWEDSDPASGGAGGATPRDRESEGFGRYLAERHASGASQPTGNEPPGIRVAQAGGGVVSDAPPAGAVPPGPGGAVAVAAPAVGGAPAGGAAPAASQPGFWRRAGSSVVSFGQGVVVDGLWGAVTGTAELGYNLVTSPVETTSAIASGIGHAVMNPRETVAGIRDGFVRAWEEDPARAIGRGVFEVGTIFVPVSRVGSAGRVARAADAVDDGGAAAAAGRQLTARVEDVAECRSGACMRPGQCFGAGTPVLTASGEKRIEQIASGDIVLARDPETGATTFERVAQTFVREAAVIDLVIRGDREEHLTVTQEHPFFVPGRGFRAASDLVAGDEVATATGTARVIALASLGEPTTVYNFEVEHAHTYFVGHAGAWVHNQCDVPVARAGGYQGTVLGLEIGGIRRETLFRENLSAAEQGVRDRVAADLARLSRETHTNPVGTGARLDEAAPRWGALDGVTVNRTDARVGESQFARMRREADELARDNPGIPRSEIDAYVAEQAYGDMLRAGGVRANYDAPERVLNVPSDFVVYGPRGERALDMSDPIEANIARLHARVQVEEYAHAAAGNIREGSYVVLGDGARLQAFEAWTQSPAGQARLAEMSPADRADAMRRIHELDIHDIHQANGGFTGAEVGRYPVRQLYEDYLASTSPGSRPPP